MSTSPDEDVVAQLLAERAATASRLADLSRDFDGVVEAARDVATDDEHDPEGQTIAFERAQIAMLRAQAQASIEALDRAIERLGTAAYGVCEGCGQPIPAARLAVRPTATRCVPCAAGA